MQGPLVLAESAPGVRDLGGPWASVHFILVFVEPHLI